MGWTILSLWVYGLAATMMLCGIAVAGIAVLLAFREGVAVPVLVGAVVVAGPPLVAEWLIQSGRTRHDA